MTAPTPADVPGQGEVAGLRDLCGDHVWDRYDTHDYCLVHEVPIPTDGLCPVTAKVLAERDAEVARAAKAEALFGFTQWVSSNRAYNGSEHRHGRSLYNECLNGVLHVWASDYLRTEPRP